MLCRPIESLWCSSSMHAIFVGTVVPLRFAFLIVEEGKPDVLSLSMQVSFEIPMLKFEFPLRMLCTPSLIMSKYAKKFALKSTKQTPFCCP